MDQLPVDGWILVDFPCSYSQAKLLEKALSGFKPLEALEPIQRETEAKEALLLVQPHPVAEPPKTLISSGLDAVIWFDAPVDECLRRADGRRFDQESPQDHYHVFDRRPPTD